jgi:hypothetical protein
MKRGEGGILELFIAAQFLARGGRVARERSEGWQGVVLGRDTV